LLEQSFTAHMLLLTATTAFGLWSNARVLLTGVTCAISVDSKFVQYSSAETQTGNNLLLLLSDLIDWQCVIIWRLIGMLFHRRPRIIGEGTCTTKQTASAHTVIVNQPLLEQIPQHRIFGKTLAGFYRLNALPCQPFNIVLPLASFCLNSFSRVTHAGDNFRDNLSRIIFLHHECLSSHPTYTVKALKGTYIAHDNQRNSLTLVELHPFLVVQDF